MKIIVIGGGVIGLCSAYYLREAGAEVMILDKGNLEEGCSYKNAGMVVPSHFIPLAAPGMVSKGIKWMFDPESPFYIQPRWNRYLLSWGWQFYRSAKVTHVERAAYSLRDIALFSKTLYQEFAKLPEMTFFFKEMGLLMLYKTSSTEKEETHTAQKAESLGIEAKVLSQKELETFEPNIRIHAKGGIYYPGDTHLDPTQFMNSLKGYLRKIGVVFFRETEVLSFEKQKNNITTVCTSKGDFKADQIVLAAGSWSGAIARLLGVKLPLEAGKGYSFNIPKRKDAPLYPTILCEAKVAVTPMQSTIRFGGTMELAGLNLKVNERRVRGIANAISNYYPEYQLDANNYDTAWSGLRPVSPDGMPYIGRSNKIHNLIIATGHAMMGMSLGPATGKLVQEIIAEQKPSLDLGMFLVERF